MLFWPKTLGGRFLLATGGFFFVLNVMQTVFAALMLFIGIEVGMKEGFDDVSVKLLLFLSFLFVGGIAEVFVVMKKGGVYLRSVWPNLFGIALRGMWVVFAIFFLWGLFVVGGASGGVFAFLLVVALMLLVCNVPMLIVYTFLCSRKMRRKCLQRALMKGAETA